MAVAYGFESLCLRQSIPIQTVSRLLSGGSNPVLFFHAYNKFVKGGIRRDFSLLVIGLILSQVRQRNQAVVINHLC